MPRELAYVIPRGPAARTTAGQDPDVLPARIRLILGVQDVLVLRNEDVVERRFGPALLAAGQSYRLLFRAPAEIPLSCSAHRDGQITIVVEGADVAPCVSGGGRERLGAVVRVRNLD